MGISVPVMMSAGSPDGRRVVGWWLVATALLTLSMVVLGGITRLTQSGLSITEWQPIMGVVPPFGEAEWQAAFEKYRQIPQYRELNAGMGLDQFKGIFFWEYLHRLIGRVTGFVGIFCAAIAMLRLPRRDWPRYLAVPVLVGLQGLLGWYMVESGLAVRTSVSQYRLTAHLATALLLYGYCVWQAASLLLPPAPADATGRRGLLALLVLVAVTIAAGGLTAGTHAGLVYNTFPLMDGRLVPSGYFVERPWWINPFENVTAIQFDHRVLAISSLVAVAGFWLRFRRRAEGRRRLFDLMLGAALVQVGLGISTLLLQVPVALAALHQTGAVLLLTAVLLALHQASTKARTHP